MSIANAKDEILEGFLCPICMQDLTSITQLQAHFEEQHEAENKAVLQSLRGFFNKAKKKFLNEEIDIGLDGSFSQRLQNPFLNSTSTIESNPWEWHIPSFVPARSHTTVFKKIRSAKIDSYVAETNKLLIRLDKLLNQIPSDSVKRKALEKDLVPWIEDKDVPLCPFCARAFNIARRRHHCRLCGSIMCDECSQFLSMYFAQKLVSPIHQGVSRTIAINTLEDRSSTHSAFGSLFGRLKRSGSHGSLNSILAVMDSFGKESGFRICKHCLLRISNRDRQVEQRSAKPLLSVYYDKLMDHRNHLTNLLPQYLKMVNSLRDGEVAYNMHDAEELRMKILKLSDSISMTSQKIRNLGALGVAFADTDTPSSPDGVKVPPEPRQEMLQRRIHSSTVSFLKDNVLGLPQLPSVQEVEFRRERRRKEMEARLVAEREAARQAEDKAAMILRKKKGQEEGLQGSSSNLVYVKKNPVEEVSMHSGWGADTMVLNVTETDDPIVQQMNIIRNYIKQAREASKYDEVSLLEANLRELQVEFKNQQRLLES